MTTKVLDSVAELSQFMADAKAKVPTSVLGVDLIDEIESYNVELTLTEDMLGGTACADVFTAHIAKKHAKAMKKEGQTDEAIATKLEEESLTMPKDSDVSMTTFAKDADGWFVWNYQARAVLVEAGSRMKQFGKIKQLRSKAQKFLTVNPRKIYFAHPDTELDVLQRPLRAETMQGPRICVAASHVAPAGTKLAFTLNSLGGNLPEECIKHMFAVAEQFVGLGRWRTGGYGKFVVSRFERDD